MPALHLLLVRQDLVAERGVGGLQRRALPRGFRQGGLLLVQAGEDRDVHAGPVHGVDGFLEVPVAALLAPLVQGEVALLQLLGEGGGPAFEGGPVGLADQQVGLGLAVLRHGTGAVREGHGALLVRAGGGRGGEEGQESEEGGEERRRHGREPAGPRHARESRAMFTFLDPPRHRVSASRLTRRRHPTRPTRPIRPCTREAIDARATESYCRP